MPGERRSDIKCKREQKVSKHHADPLVVDALVGSSSSSSLALRLIQPSLSAHANPSVHCWQLQIRLDCKLGVE
ncbi:hypothetical protein PoMZ_12350 [Pyricularia oryzae]|uniref:Uncharacterized protein n=1 Tax=Pyricularia oryzae TaxID=318829 RepID=A0A4P7NSE1_PYROR|nr:hypothetical protein PoMZ_12350 [Pyricularia oryzae]